MYSLNTAVDAATNTNYSSTNAVIQPCRFFFRSCSKCISVPCPILCRERKGIGSLKLAEGSPLHGWPVTPFRGQKVKVTRRWTLWPKISISSEWEGLRTSNLVHWWSMMTRITDMRGDLQVERPGWLFKSPFAGTHYRLHILFNCVVLYIVCLYCFFTFWVV